MRLLDGITLFRPLLALQQLVVELLLNINQVLFAPELGKENRIVNPFRAADQRRAGPAQVIAFFGNRRRLIGKIAGFGQLAGVHFEPERLLHFANRGFESLGNRLHGIVVVHADRRMKRVETVGKIILTRKILKDALSLLTGL